MRGVIDARPARTAVCAAVDPGAVHGPHSTRCKVDQPRRLRVEDDIGDPTHARRHGGCLPGGAVVAAGIHVADEVVTRIVGDQQMAGHKRVRRQGRESPLRQRGGYVPPQVGPGVTTIRAAVDAVVFRRVNTIGIGGVGAYGIHNWVRAGNLHEAPSAGAIETAIDARPEPEGGKDP